MKYRTHVMYLWAVHLSLPSLKDLSNIPYRLRLICRLDWLALLYFIPGGLVRLGELAAKFPRKLKVWITAGPDTSIT